MSRRRESSFDLLIALPWYVALAIAAVLFLGAESLATWVVARSPLFAQLKHPGTILLKILAGICLAAGGLSALRGFYVRRRFAAQRSIDDLRALSWQQFETIVGEAFRRRGYSVLETGQGGADGGVDLVLTKAGERFLVQCKQYRASTVSVMVVREIFGVVAAQRAAGAIIVTTGKFTKDAIEFAAKQPIELIDGVKLEAMVREINQVSVPPSMTDASGVPSTSPPPPPSRRRSSSALSSPTAPTAPTVSPSCPKCGAEMVLRTPRAGGDHFYGCSTFPKCRGTRPAS